MKGRFRDNTCVVCFRLFTSYRKRRHCSDACRKREARGEKCVCGHYKTRHTGSESWPCKAEVGRVTCFCSEFRPARVRVDVKSDTSLRAARADTAGEVEP